MVCFWQLVLWATKKSDCWLYCLWGLHRPHWISTCREVDHSLHWKCHLLTYGIWESICLPIWGTCIQTLICFLIWIILPSIRFLYVFFPYILKLHPCLCSLPFPDMPQLKHLLPYYFSFDFSTALLLSPREHDKGIHMNKLMLELQD